MHLSKYQLQRYNSTHRQVSSTVFQQCLVWCQVSSRGSSRSKFVTKRCGPHSWLRWRLWLQRCLPPHPLHNVRLVLCVHPMGTSNAAVVAERYCCPMSCTKAPQGAALHVCTNGQTSSTHGPHPQKHRHHIGATSSTGGLLVYMIVAPEILASPLW